MNQHRTPRGLSAAEYENLQQKIKRLQAENEKLKKENQYQAKIGAQQFEQLKSEGKHLRGENERLKSFIDEWKNVLLTNMTEEYFESVLQKAKGE